MQNLEKKTKKHMDWPLLNFVWQRKKPHINFYAHVHACSPSYIILTRNKRHCSRLRTISLVCWS